MKLILPFLALARLATCKADSLLRKQDDQAGRIALITKLLDRIETLEMRIEELEGTIETLESAGVGRHLAVDPCAISYNSVTGMCHTNNTFAFEHPVEIADGVTTSGEAKFADKLYMMGGGEVLGGELTSHGPAMFTKGLEVRGGFISFNTTTRVGNMTIDGTTIVGKTTFMDPVEFKDYVTFDDDVQFGDDVHFDGEEVKFDSEVTFKMDVCFEDDVYFKDDVAILGPTSSDTSESSTDFEIYGYVNVDFKQKRPMDVYPETRFRDDVSLVHGSSSSTSSSRSSSSSGTSSSYASHSGSRSSSGDYSSFSHDTIPQLIVAGDVTSGADLKVLGDLHVEGTSALKADATVQGDLTVTGTGDFGAVTTDSLLVDGTSSLRGATTVTTGNLEVNKGDVVIDNGGVTATGGDITVNNGNVDINNGNLAVNSGMLGANGDATVGGDLFVVGSSGGNNDWTFPAPAPV